MTKRPRRVGRPVLPSQKRRSRSITFRVPQPFANRLESAATANSRSLTEEIIERLDFADTFPDALMLSRDIVSAARIIGDWNGDEEKQTMIRAVVRILVDAHSGVIPKDLLESKRYGSTEARILAFAILRERAIKQRKDKP